jgi:hypothetical protein
MYSFYPRKENSSMNAPLIRRIVVVATVLMAILASALPAAAAATTTNFIATCTSVTYSGTNDSSGGNDFSTLTISANGEQIYESQPFDFSPFEIDAVIPITLEPGTYVIEVLWDILPAGSAFATTTIVCGEDEPVEPVAPLSGAICFGPGEVAAAVYIYPEEFEIYSIADDKGLLSIRLTNEELYTSPRGSVIAEANTVLPIALSRQSDGNFRVLVGPEPREGKLYECVFNVVCSRTRSWLPGSAPSGAIDLSTCGTEATLQ